MYLVLFLYIAAFFSLALGEFGQFPFGQTMFSVSITDILLTANLTVLAVWNIGIKKNLRIPNNFLWLAGFWLITFLSLLISLNLSGWLYWFRFVIYSGCFYLSYHLTNSGILGKDEFFKLVKFVCLLVAVLGIGQLWLFPDLGPLEILGYDPHKNRLFSSFLDPNFTGSFLSFGALISIYELLKAKYSGLKKYIFENKYNLIFALLIFTSIILTLSRSAYLMLFTGLFLMLSLRKKFLLVPLFLLPLILYLTYPPFSDRIKGGFLIDESAVHRFYSWEKGLTIFQHHPFFGAGFNNIRDASEELNLLETFSPDGGNAGSGVDSSLIFILATTGIIGFLSFASFLGKIVYENIKGLLNKKRRSSGLILPILAGLIINSIFINSLFYPPIMFLWFSLIGVYYGLGEGDGEGS